jgi:hypothetical protein
MKFGFCHHGKKKEKNAVILSTSNQHSNSKSEVGL